MQPDGRQQGGWAWLQGGWPRLLRLRQDGRSTDQPEWRVHLRHDGDFLATRNENMPSVIWIWSTRGLHQLIVHVVSVHLKSKLQSYYLPCDFP